MNDDAKHLLKQAQKDLVNATEAEKRAQVERSRAQQYDMSDANSRATFHIQSAERLEEKAEDLREEAAQREQAAQEKESQAAALEQERAALVQAHDQKIAEIDRRIAQLRGSGLV